jgi:hypothetical protein
MKCLHPFALASATLLLIVLTPLAKAQLSVYGSINLTRFGYASTVTGNGFYDPGSGSFSFYKDTFGLEAGATHMFQSASRLRAGIDVRDIYSPGNLGGDAGFASLRIAFVPRTHALSPYLQLGGGFITLQYPTTACTEGIGGATCISGHERITGGAADLLFGLNIRASSAWSIRAIEFGGYAGPNVELSTIGAGVVYTFQPGTRHNP